MHKTKLMTMAAAGAAVVITFAFTASAFAETSGQSFMSAYEQNAQLEASLQQRAMANGMQNPSAVSLNSTIQTINSQVATLYSAEQALTNAIPALPPAFQGNWQHNQHGDRGEKGKKMQVEKWQLNLGRLIRQQDHPQLPAPYRQGQYLNSALSSLRTSILDLQKSAIQYLYVWLSLPATNTQPGNPATITGLTFAEATIPVPALGAAPVYDPVVGAPVVKDQYGNTLSDTGTYSLIGPNGSAGVTVNPSNGELTVVPGATVGTYTVIYVQGGVMQRVVINIV